MDSRQSSITSAPAANEAEEETEEGLVGNLKAFFNHNQKFMSKIYLQQGITRGILFIVLYFLADSASRSTMTAKMILSYGIILFVESFSRVFLVLLRQEKWKMGRYFSALCFAANALISVIYVSHQGKVFDKDIAVRDDEACVSIAYCAGAVYLKWLFIFEIIVGAVTIGLAALVEVVDNRRKRE